MPVININNKIHLQTYNNITLRIACYGVNISWSKNKEKIKKKDR